MAKVRISRCILIVLIIVTSFFAYSIFRIQSDYNKARLGVLTEQMDKQLTYVLDNLFHNLDIVEQVVITSYNEDNTDILDAIFTPLIEDLGYRNITILPNGAVSYIYPIEGNESAIGDNIFHIEGRVYEANLAKDSRKTIISGPYELTQGGEAFIARKAIYNDEEFWGFVAITIDKSTLLDQINVNGFRNSEYKYQFLSTVNQLDSKIVSQSEGFIGENAMWATIELENGTMSFGVDPKSNTLLYIVTISILLVGYLLSYLVSRYIKKIEYNLKIANREIYLDKLTGVNNRKLLDHLDNQFSLSSIDYTVVYIDLNDFKPINDNYGHDVGDEVLINFCKRLQEIIRESDYIIRMGGDEFIVILPKTTTDDSVMSFCQRLEEIQLQTVKIGDITLNIKFSYGYAISYGEGEKLSKVIEEADGEMYKAKHQGKKQVGKN